MDSITFLGGALLGLSSSLHCAAMCGGLASTLVMGLGRDATFAARMEALIAALFGKTLAYAAAGAVLGALGASVYGLFDRQAAYFILQRVGAAGLAWIGFSLLGLVPGPAAFDRVLAPARLFLLRHRASGPAVTASLAGFAWGMMPCAMVYGALFYAMLAGSALGGMGVMIGFGLGTIPALAAGAFGLGKLAQLARTPRLQTILGVALLVIAAVTLIAPAGAIQALCALPR